MNTNKLLEITSEMCLSAIIFGLTIGIVSLITVTAVPFSEDGLELLNLNLTNRLASGSNASAAGYGPSFEWHDYSMT